MACCWVGLECPLRLVVQCLFLRVVHRFALGSTGVPWASDVIGRFWRGTPCCFHWLFGSCLSLLAMLAAPTDLCRLDWMGKQHVREIELYTVGVHSHGAHKFYTYKQSYKPKKSISADVKFPADAYAMCMAFSHEKCASVMVPRGNRGPEASPPPITVGRPDRYKPWRARKRLLHKRRAAAPSARRAHSSREILGAIAGAF